MKQAICAPTFRVYRRDNATSQIDILEDISTMHDQALMHAYVEAILPTTRVVILNFKKKHVMNSYNIGLLITLLIRAKHEQQDVMVVELNEYDRRIFALTHLDQHISVFETAEQALATIDHQ